MVIYFTNRYGRILTSVGSDLPNNFRLIEDKLTDELETGIKTFECTMIADDDIRESATVGNYCLVNNSIFTIVTSTYKTYDGEMELYCEDAGLDFLNRICGQISKQSQKFSWWIEKTLGSSSSSGWTYDYSGVNSNTKKTLEYTSETNVTDRLQDLLESYDYEMYFTYDIDGFAWKKRTIHFTKSRGNNKRNMHRLYMDVDVKSIVEKASVEDLATEYLIYGVNKSGDVKALKNLTNYSSINNKTFTSGDYKFKISGNYITCISVTDRWKSTLDKDGKITQAKYTQYTSAVDAKDYAIRELKKVIEPSYEYEVEFVKLPDDMQCGDYMYILDAHDDLLLSARVLSFSTSDCKNEHAATLGEFKRLSNSMADIDYSKLVITNIQISSSKGVVGELKLETTLKATVVKNNVFITSTDELETGEYLQWYKDGVAIDGANDFSIDVSTSENCKYSCRLQKDEDGEEEIEEEGE